MMRWGGPTVILALLLGATPAPAQDSPGVIPAPAQPSVKSKSVHAAPKAVVAKLAAPAAAAPKIAAPSTTAKADAPSSELAKAEPAPLSELSAGERLKI